VDRQGRTVNPYCQNPPLPGAHTCRLHGARTGRGPANPAWKHGGRSRCLPQGIRKPFERAAADPQLTELTQDLALLEVRLLQLCERLEGHESGATWEAVLEAEAGLRAGVGRLRAASNAGDMDGFRAAMGAIEGQIAALSAACRDAAAERSTWDELRSVMGQRADFAAREWKRQVDLRSVITAERAQALITAIAHAIVRTVGDPHTRARLVNEVLLLSGMGDVVEGQAREG
jgi:hypothetical protein